MKITILVSFIAFFLYALFGYQLDRIRIMTDESMVMKSTITGQNLTINKLEDYRESLKPPRFLPLGWPMVIDEYDDLTSYYAFRNDPLRRNTGGSTKKFHAAVDMKGIKGAQVLSVAGGIVIDKWYDAGWHNGIEYDGHPIFNGYIIILHDDGMISHYGHISDILVHEGERVETGQPIARISRQIDKYSTGPHLDFRLQNESGGYVNPLLWIGEGI